jgi:hypothetical protein
LSKRRSRRGRTTFKAMHPPPSFSAASFSFSFPSPGQRVAAIRSTERLPHGRNRPLFGRSLSSLPIQFLPLQQVASCNLHIYVEARIAIDIEYEAQASCEHEFLHRVRYLHTHLCMRPLQAVWLTLTRHSRVCICTTPLPIGWLPLYRRSTVPPPRLSSSKSLPGFPVQFTTCELPLLVRMREEEREGGQQIHYRTVQ